LPLLTRAAPVPARSGRSSTAAPKDDPRLSAEGLACIQADARAKEAGKRTNADSPLRRRPFLAAGTRHRRPDRPAGHRVLRTALAAPLGDRAVSWLFGSAASPFGTNEKAATSSSSLASPPP
jgi:hypothetical protein